MTRRAEISAQPVLLGLLLSAPRHGYELHQEFRRELGSVWTLGLSQLYADLKELEQGGLVSAQAEPQANRPARKVYHLTSSGHASFFEWLSRPCRRPRDIRLEFLARLYFYRRLALPGLEKLAIDQKAVCQGLIETLARARDAGRDEFQRLVLDFRCGQLQAIVDWLDRCSTGVAR